MTNNDSTDSKFLEAGIKVLENEAEALSNLAKNLDHTFVGACKALLACKGRIIVTGMGKSGHVGKKIAATLASTGSPSFFLHPAEGSHGDLGMVTRDDTILALSNSGETDEILTLLPLFKRLDVCIISITANPQSQLAKNSNHHLHIKYKEEACSLGLAPTTSTTATLAIGDAIAVALLTARGFSTEDFAFSHPAGKLGKKLLVKVSDVMHEGEECPIVFSDTTLPDVLYEISRKRLGITMVVERNNPQKILGICTDGDLRRAFTQDHQIDVQNTPVSKVMNEKFITISSNVLAAEAVHIIQQNKINALPVVDSENNLLGAFNMHDLFQAGVV